MHRASRVPNCQHGLEAARGRSTVLEVAQHSRTYGEIPCRTSLVSPKHGCGCPAENFEGDRLFVVPFVGSYQPGSWILPVRGLAAVAWGRTKHKPCVFITGCGFRGQWSRVVHFPIFKLDRKLPYLGFGERDFNALHLQLQYLR